MFQLQYTSHLYNTKIEEYIIIENKHSVTKNETYTIIVLILSTYPAIIAKRFLLFTQVSFQV